MDILQQFLTYAGEFERTLADDDWTRLRRFFAADAVYEVTGAAFACRLVGPDAIFAGIKKSLDGFDRKFDKREIDVTHGPAITGHSLSMGWQVVYSLAGKPDFVLRGHSSVRYADGVIAHLTDSYDARVADELAAWQQASGVRLHPAYT